jgi:hypothetical protein
MRAPLAPGFYWARSKNHLHWDGERWQVVEVGPHDPGLGAYVMFAGSDHDMPLPVFLNGYDVIRPKLEPPTVPPAP